MQNKLSPGSDLGRSGPCASSDSQTMESRGDFQNFCKMTITLKQQISTLQRYVTWVSQMQSRMIKEGRMTPENAHRDIEHLKACLVTIQKQQWLHECSEEMKAK